MNSKFKFIFMFVSQIGWSSNAHAGNKFFDALKRCLSCFNCFRTTVVPDEQATISENAVSPSVHMHLYPDDHDPRQNLGAPPDDQIYAVPSGMISAPPASQPGFNPSVSHLPLPVPEIVFSSAQPTQQESTFVQHFRSPVAIGITLGQIYDAYHR